MEVISPSSLSKILIVILTILYFTSYFETPEKPLSEILTSDKFFVSNAMKSIIPIEFETIRRKQAKFCPLSHHGNFLPLFDNDSKLCLQYNNQHLLEYLRLCNNIEIFMIVQSYKDLLGFLLIFFAAIFGFTYVWWFAFSPYDEKLITLLNTTFEIFQFFATGNRVVVTDLIRTNEFWAILLIIITCFIIFIQLDAIMMSLIQENVRYLYLVMQNSTKDSLPFRESLNSKQPSQFFLTYIGIYLKVQRIKNRILGIFIKKKPQKKK